MWQYNIYMQAHTPTILKVHTPQALPRDALEAIFDRFGPVRVSYKPQWAYFEFSEEEEARRFDAALHEEGLPGLAQESV